MIEYVKITGNRYHIVSVGTQQVQLRASLYANISSQASCGRSQFPAAWRGLMPLVSASSQTAEAKSLRPLTQSCRPLD